MRLKNCFNFIFFVIFFTKNLFANQIGIGLPEVLGEIPKRIQNTKPLQYNREFALLTQDILEQEFIVSTKILDSELSSSESLKSCPHPSIHYYLKDSFQFSSGGAPILYSVLANCKTGMKLEKESILTGYAVDALQKHYRALFRFLPKKEKESYTVSKGIQWKVYLFLDANGSMAYEKENLEKWIAAPKGESNWLQTTYLSNNKETKVIPNLNHPIEIPFVSSNNTPEILNSLYRFISIPTTQWEKAIQFIYLSPNHITNFPQITNAINRARQMNKETVIIVPPHCHLKDIKDYERIANSTQSQILFIEAKQIVGFSSGIRGTLNLSRGYLRFQVEGQSNELKYPLDERISPYFMVETIERIQKDKVIQKEIVETNLVNQLQNTINRFKNPAGWFGKKILVQSSQGAMWIYVKDNIKLNLRENYILETVFYLEPSEVIGITNDPFRTKFLPKNKEYPLLLEYNFMEIPEIIKKYKLDELRGFIPVRVVEEN